MALVLIQLKPDKENEIYYLSLKTFMLAFSISGLFKLNFKFFLFITAFFSVNQIISYLNPIYLQENKDQHNGKEKSI